MISSDAMRGWTPGPHPASWPKFQPDPVINLTARQLQVLSLYKEIGSFKMVAAYMDVSPHTVRNHATLAYARLGVTNATDAFRVLGWLR